MAKDFIDMTGLRVKRLLVLERAPNKITNSGRTEVMWRCICDCGKEKITPGKSLRNGCSCSCGCRERMRDLLFTPDERLYNIKRYEASRRGTGIEFTIPREEFVSLSKQDCVYCGTPPSHTHKLYRKSEVIGSVDYNGIDRVDNTKGYISGNCVPCCWTCNAMKLKLTLDEFKQKITLIYNRICK